MSAFRVEVRVMPRAALLDPQGQAVEHALHALGFGEVAQVRMGMIRFGSRVDVFLAAAGRPALRVAVGDRVRAGASVLAEYPS